MAASERIFSLGPFVRRFLFVLDPLFDVLFDAVANLITSFTQEC
jgi:hypothetical protein